MKAKQVHQHWGKIYTFKAFKMSINVNLLNMVSLCSMDLTESIHDLYSVIKHLYKIYGKLEHILKYEWTK